MKKPKSIKRECVGCLRKKSHVEAFTNSGQIHYLCVQCFKCLVAGLLYG